MEMKEIFAKRLKSARLIKGLSMDDLVSAMDNSISKMAISKYENGLLAPNTTILIALSKALNQPVDYFFRPFDIKVESIKFRKKTKLGAKQEKAIKEEINDLVERYMSIESICNCLAQFSSPVKECISIKSDVKKAAQDIRTAWQIGFDNIASVIDLLENKGIKVLELDAPDSFDGLSSMVNEHYPVIVLNKNCTPERKRFNALHELGHIALNFSDSVSEKEEERLCHFFASEMLIPESVFKCEVGLHRQNISYPELRYLQCKYGISPEALMYKAKENGIISEKQHKEFCVQKNSCPSFKEKISSALYPREESNRFSNLVYTALSCEMITISKAANLLNHSIDQVRKDLAIL